MRAEKIRQARRWLRAHRTKIAEPAQGSVRVSQDGASVGRRPLFVFNVKLFDDRLLPAMLGSSSQWPHRYVVVIRHPDGTTQGDGPLRTRLEADDAASRALLALSDRRVHVVVATDESEEALDAFFADPNSVQAVAEESARARERYEEWRRKAGPVRPAYTSSAGRYRGALAPAFS